MGGVAIGRSSGAAVEFHKYLIDAKGELAGTFGSKVAPEDAALTTAIEAELNK